ncbi:MAG: internal scaffolding protein [Microvirus sp.]|nr:MAG: internal scaffolding protein [Microvirus sp.]
MDNTMNPQTGEIYQAKVTPFLATPYNLNTTAWSDASGLYCPEPTKTKISEQPSTDINEIVRQFGLTGQLPDNPLPPQYGDFSDVLDYHTALTAIRRSEEAFADLPAALRARFSNDPGQLVEFLADEANRTEAAQLGLITPPQDARLGGGTGAPPSPPPSNPEPPKA